MLASLAVPAVAHADLVQSPPVAVEGGHFDDHSIGGDDHLGWSHGASDPEPLSITFGSTLTNTGPDPFRVCGYASATSDGWMRAFESPTAPCPPAAPAGQDGWFRYVTANHDNPERELFNRWHLMDLQRFALVPLPPAAGGPPGALTAWDTYWGTCLNDSQYMACERNADAEAISTNIAVGATKTTQEQNPAPDSQRIAIPADSRSGFPDGLYQVIAVANPYGRFSGAPSVACVTVSVSGMGQYTSPVVQQVGGLPATCYVPTPLAPALTGPEGRDPMTDAVVDSGCPLLPSGHCWPGPLAPATGDHPAARTNVTPATGVALTNNVPVAQAGGVQDLPAPAPGTRNPPANAAGQSHRPTPVSSPRRLTEPAPVSSPRRLTERRSRGYARRGLRRHFGKKVRRLKVTCKLRSSSTAATCRVSWRKGRARYKGHVRIRYRTVDDRLRWQYRVDVKKKRPGMKATKVRRSYRTGGTF